jgi:carbon storage regulator
MLVLSRRPGEEIVIGDTIRLRVVAIDGNRVRLGFTAPADTFICREELRLDMERSGRKRPPPAGLAAAQASRDRSAEIPEQ